MASPQQRHRAHAPRSNGASAHDQAGPPASSGHAAAEPEPDYETAQARALLVATFLSLFGAGMVAARRANGELPDRVSPVDVVLIGVATHKVSRIVTKAKATEFLRLPFTRPRPNAQPAAPAEVESAPRGSGVQRAVGELLTCPYCIGQWIAGAFTVGMVANPRATRVLAATWSALAVSDVANLGYVWAQKQLRR